MNNDETITNNGAAYLRAHVELETEGADLARANIAAAVDLDLVRILPSMSVAQIAKLCIEHEAYCHIDTINGQTVAYLRRNSELPYLPAFLRRQAT